MGSSGLDRLSSRMLSSMPGGSEDSGERFRAPKDTVLPSLVRKSLQSTKPFYSLLRSPLNLFRVQGDW